MLLADLAITEAEGLGHLHHKSLHERGDPLAGDHLELIDRDRVLVVEAGKEELHQLLAGRRDGALGGKVGAVETIDPADFLIGINEGVYDVSLIAVHGGEKREGMHADTLSKKKLTLFLRRLKAPKRVSSCRTRRNHLFFHPSIAPADHRRAQFRQTI